MKGQPATVLAGLVVVYHNIIQRGRGADIGAAAVSRALVASQEHIAGRKLAVAAHEQAAAGQVCLIVQDFYII